MYDFPEIPESLSDLSVDELNDLISRTREMARQVLAARKAGDDVPAEAWAAASASPGAIEALRAEVATRRADEAAEAAIDALEDDDEDSDEDEDADDGDSDDDEDNESDDTEVSDDDTEASDDDAGDEDADSEAGDSGGAGDLHEKAPGSKNRPGAGRPKGFTFTNGVKGHDIGAEVPDMVVLAEAMQDRYADIQGGSTEKVAVAQIKAHFTEDMLEAPSEVNWSDPDSIQAGLTCVPRENLYDVGCASSNERPFANSLPNKRAPRGGFSVYPSPTMADVTDRQDEITGEGVAADNGDGTGLWTRADDGDLTAVKNACAVIPCGTPENFDIYGVYRCITVRNLLQLTFPELVAAYLNKLGALWARLAETTLLDAMVNSPWSIDVTQAAVDDVGALSNLLDTLVQVALVYTEQDRYADGMKLGVWLHRWVATLIIRDFLKAPRYNPTVAELVMVRSQINKAFSDAGFNVHWVMDSATSWESIDTQADGAELVGLPTRVDMKIAPDGNFQRLDLGTLTVGVTNRNPWDKDDMARNQFTMFWESYEGIIDNGCPSWNLSIDPLCANGLMHYAPAEAPVCVTNDSGA